MKQVFDTNFNNVTSETQAYLMSTPTVNLVVKDVWFIGPPVLYPGSGLVSQSAGSNYGAYPIVDGDYPVSFQGITYQPFSVEKDKLEYKTGFEASKVSLTLRPREYPQLVGALSTYTRGSGQSYSQNLNVPPPYSDQYLTLTGQNTSTGLQAFQTMRQGFASTDWYFAPVTMIRMWLSAPTVGGTVMFRGRIDGATVDRFEIKLSVPSLMTIFTQKVPTQLVEPGNRFIAWNFSATPDSTGTNVATEGGYTWFQSNQSYSENTYAEGWIVLNIAGYGSFTRRVFTNYGPYIYMYEPLPVNLGTAGLSITYSLWSAADTATVAEGVGQGFPSVPRPEVGLL